MFSKELEEVIEAALADGALTDKERAVLHKRAQAEGVDPDELDVVIDGRLAKMKRHLCNHNGRFTISALIVCLGIFLGSRSLHTRKRLSDLLFHLFCEICDKFVDLSVIRKDIVIFNGYLILKVDIVILKHQA